MTRVYDGGPWRGITTEEQVERIARGSTPVREYVDGKFQPWIERPATRRAGEPDLAGFGEPRAETSHQPAGSPDGSSPGSVGPTPSRRGPVAAAG